MRRGFEKTQYSSIFFNWKYRLNSQINCYLSLVFTALPYASDTGYLSLFRSIFLLAESIKSISNLSASLIK